MASQIQAIFSLVQGKPKAKVEAATSLEENQVSKSISIFLTPALNLALLDLNCYLC